MMQLWFHAQKKTRRREALPQYSAPARSEVLGVEILEDRTAPSITGGQPPVVVAVLPILPIAVVATEAQPHSVNSLDQVHDGATLSPLEQVALRKLLADVQTISSMGSPGAAPASLDAASLSILFPGGSSGLTLGKSTSDVPSNLGNDAYRPPAPPNAGNVLGKTGASSGNADKSGGNVAKPAKAPNLPNGAGDAQVTPQARAAETPEVGLSRTDAVPNSAEAFGRIPAFAREVAAVAIARMPSVRSPFRPGTSTGRVADEEAAPSEPTGARINAAGLAESESSAVEVSDGLLLHRFVTEKESDAFTALVERYEGPVLGICQRVLGDSHLALDAFQATFLVLARNASKLDQEGSLAGWLWKVAYRIALRLRFTVARQRRRENEAGGLRPIFDSNERLSDLEQQEALQALNEELERLPEELRLPLVLCYFEGRTHAEAAVAIGLPRGSMAKRVTEGLRRLRERLSLRGFID